MGGGADVKRTTARARNPHEPSGTAEVHRAADAATASGDPPEPSALPIRAMHVGAVAITIVVLGLRATWPDAAVAVAVAVLALRALAMPDRRAAPAERSLVARPEVGVALAAGAVVATGGWASALVLCLVPAVVHQTVRRGEASACLTTAVAVLAVTAADLVDGAALDVARAGAPWIGVLVLAAWLGTVVHRMAGDAAERHARAERRSGQLAETNALLVSLQRVAGTLPASLDVAEVVASTTAQVERLVTRGAARLYLYDEAHHRLALVGGAGDGWREVLPLDELPAAVQRAVSSPRTVRVPRLVDGDQLRNGAATALYAALRARGDVFGLLAVEAEDPEPYELAHAELMEALAGPCSTAIDNALLFRQLRTVAAHEERLRVARDLHDHVGSSVALLGFELDRVRSLHARGDDVAEPLEELREHLTVLIRQIRETLEDLRTDVSTVSELHSTLQDHLRRVAARTGLAVTAHLDGSLPLSDQQARELWRIALEAITNVERHARASSLAVELRTGDGRVTLRIDDDGIGLQDVPPRADAYGMIGMSERAEALGATLRFHARAGGGTRVEVELDGAAAAAEPLAAVVP